MTIYRLPFNQLTLFIIHFSVPSVPALSLSKGSLWLKKSCYPVQKNSLRLGVFVAETQLAAAKPFGEDGSIKNVQLCKTNPISAATK